MKIKSLICSLAIGAGLVTSNLLANSVTFSGGIGDEVIVHSSNNGTFASFCLEANVFVSSNGVYTYTINPDAIAGGPNMHGPAGPGGGDLISFGTTWLFTQFHNGTLDDAFAGGGGNYKHHELQNSVALQNAIWMLEDEITPTTTNFYLNEVQAIFGSKVYDNANSDVIALNPWKGKTDVQSFLYMPDGGMTALLLGLGLVGLSVAARRSRKV